MHTDIKMHIIKGTDGTRYILPSGLESIRNATRFMKKVIYGKETYYTTYTSASGNQRRTVSSLGEHAKYLHTYRDLFSSEGKLSPLLEFLAEEYRKHPIQEYVLTIRGMDITGIKLFDDFVATMRKQAVEKKLKKKAADWDSKPKKNLAAVAKFENELFQRCGRVLAIRLDLDYHKAMFTPDEVDRIIKEGEARQARACGAYWAGEGNATPRTLEGRIALEEVQQDRKRLFANMKGKPSLFKELVGYVWVIEFGKAAGYHLHLMLFFDGSAVKKHEHLAQLIGEYWADDITQGRGYFENCNRKKEKYGADWALGDINHWDTEKRTKLMNAMSYFCKTNQMVQVTPYPGCHLFGCGFVHRKRKDRGGRPRTRKAIGLDRQRLQ